MSLLMDALRKAEADKRQSAEQQDDSANPELELDDNGPDAPTREFVGTSSANAASTTDADTPAAPVEGLTLEPIEPLDATGPSAATTVVAHGAVESTQTAAEDQSEDQLEALLNATTPGPQQTQQATGKRDSGITQTVATADTIFAAKQSGPSRRVVVWGIACGLLLACILAAGGVYYYFQAPSVYEIPSPQVALEVQRPVPQRPVVVVENEPLPPLSADASPTEPVALALDDSDELAAPPAVPAADAGRRHP